MKRTLRNLLNYLALAALWAVYGVSELCDLIRRLLRGRR